MIKLRNLLAVLLTAVAALSASGYAYNGLTYQDGYAAGRWGTSFVEAKAYAKAHNIPLVTVWANPGCGYCAAFERAVAGAAVTRWAADRKYLFVFALGTKTDESQGMVAADVTAAKSFAANATGEFPYVCVWWPKGPQGREIKSRFSGRNGKLPRKEGALAAQFMASVDAAVGAYADVWQLSVSAAAGGTATGGGLVPGGSVQRVKATAAVGSVFAGWQRGSEVLSQNPTFDYLMPSEAVALKATFIAKSDDWLKVSFAPAAEYARGVAIEPISVTAVGASLVRSCTLTGLPSGLVFANGTITGTPKKSGLFTVVVKATSLGGTVATETRTMRVRAAGERVVQGACEAERGRVSGSGIYADGKRATLRATAKAGWVFVGWLDEAGRLLSRQPTLTVTVAGADLSVTAAFVTKAEDLSSMALALDGAGLSFEGGVSTNAICQGVRLRWPLVARALSPVTLSATSLPAGLKLEKTLVDRAEKLYDYALVGVPTTASKTDSRSGVVKPTVARLKVSTAGGNTRVVTVAFVVEPLNPALIGRFTGCAAADQQGTGPGVASLSVTSAGRLSGKFTVGGTNWTYAVTGFTAADGSFTGLARSGSRMLPFQVTMKEGAAGCTRVEGRGEGLAFILWRDIWKERPDLPSPAVPKTSLEALGFTNGLYLTVTATGNATFSGRLNDGTRVSATSTVFLEESGGYRLWLIVPARSGYSGWWSEVEL